MGPISPFDFLLWILFALGSLLCFIRTRKAQRTYFDETDQARCERAFGATCFWIVAALVFGLAFGAMTIRIIKFEDSLSDKPAVRFLQPAPPSPMAPVQKSVPIPPPNRAIAKYLFQKFVESQTRPSR